MAFLNVNSNLVAFSDACVGNNQPLKKSFDWTVQVNGDLVSSPESKQFQVPPGVVFGLFGGAISTGVDNTTTFALTLNPILPGVYRMTWTGGAAPQFRVDRALNLSTEVVTVTVNNNVTATFALASTAPQDFAAVSVGDTVWIPSVATGDPASPFNAINTGAWVVLAKGSVLSVSNKSLTLRRPIGDAFSGAPEVVTVASAGQFQAFSPNPVQAGYSLNINAGFSPVTWGTYVLTAVNPAWIEFASTESLPLETGVMPDNAGVVIYTQARRFIHLESDQLITVRVNGDTGSFLKVMPRVVGNPKGVGYIELWGPVWELTVVNLAPGDVANLQLISCE